MSEQNEQKPQKAPIVVISPQSRVWLEEMKLNLIKKGFRPTLGGIVDNLIKDEYERTKAQTI